MNEKTKKVWSKKCDKTLVATEESAEAVIQKCSVRFLEKMCEKWVSF